MRAVVKKTTILWPDTFRAAIIWYNSQKLVCCIALQCVAMCCGVLQCVAVCCGALQCVAGTAVSCRHPAKGQRTATH